jgi:PAS domain-containing protein
LSERILIHAPRGRDAQVIESVLQRAGIFSETCPDLHCIRRKLERDVGAVLLTEEALAGEGLDPLLAWCDAQAPWSDLPVIVLATKQAGRRSVAAASHLQRLGNVILLERPVNAETLLSAANSALRVRRRQYQARNLIVELKQAQQNLSDLNETLEQRVDERTAERDRIWRNSRDLLLAIGTDGIFRDVNPAWTRLFGHSRAEVVGATRRTSAI